MSITREQAKKLNDQLYPHANYLIRLRERALLELRGGAQRMLCTGQGRPPRLFRLRRRFVGFAERRPVLVDPFLLDPLDGIPCDPELSEHLLLGLVQGLGPVLGLNQCGKDEPALVLGRDGAGVEHETPVGQGIGGPFYPRPPFWYAASSQT